MGRELEGRSGASSSDPAAAPERTAPGKRTLTESLRAPADPIGRLTSLVATARNDTGALADAIARSDCGIAMTTAEYLRLALRGAAAALDELEPGADRDRLAAAIDEVAAEATPLLARAPAPLAAGESYALAETRWRAALASGTSGTLAGGGAGQPLPADLRASFERSLGADLGAVRVHTGAHAASATDAVGARAVAVGTDVAFGAGQYAPQTSDGRWLLAHEVAHTVQQRGAPPAAQHELETTQPGDAAESEADRAADAMVEGKPAMVSARPHAIARVVMGPIGGGARDDTPEWKKIAGPAKAYVELFGSAIINGVHSRLGWVPFQTGLDGATWRDGSASAFAGQFALLFFMERDDPWKFLVTTLAPYDVERLVDKGRDALRMPQFASAYNQGVELEIANVYKSKLHESLLRVVPRYASVWNQHVLAEQAKLGRVPPLTPLPPAREPAVTEVRASAPIDAYVIRALSGRLAIDFARYRELHRKEREPHAIKGVDKVTLDIQWQQKAINWARATPADATAEDVAAELYGSETFAYLITPAPPLFGFDTSADHIDKLASRHRDKLRAITGSNDYHGSAAPLPGTYDAVAGQVLGGPLGDEAAKNQARDVAPTPNLTKAAIVKRLRTIVDEFAEMQTNVAPWGQQTLLGAAKAKVDRRSRDIDKDGDPAAGLAWDGQSQIQLEVVQTCRRAIEMAATQEEAFKSFPDARWLIGQLVSEYIGAAAVSDLGATARAKLAAVEQRSKLFPADVMEALLETLRPIIQTARVKKTRLDGKAGDWDSERYGSGAMANKERELRHALARVRDLLMDDPNKAKAELKRLKDELTDLATEVTLVSNMDSCDAAWAALDGSLSKIGRAVSWFSSDYGNDPLKADMAVVATMRQEWRAIYDRWKGAKTPKEKKDAEDDLQTKAKSYGWTDMFAKIREHIDDQATLDKWVTFGVMVGIAIITGGIGAYVETAAGAAWGAVAGFAASTVVEAATFTTLSQTLVQKDATLSSFFSDFEKNALMFGGLKAVGKVWGVSGEAMGLTGAELKAGGILVQFAALNGVALYEADAEQRKQTGKGLSWDQITSLSFHNLAFLVAVSLGQWLAKPFLKDLVLKGQLQGELVAARSAGAKVDALAAKVEAQKGKDPAQNRELNAALAEAIAKREAMLAKLGEQMKLYEAGDKASVLSKKQYEQIKDQLAEHGQQKLELQRMQIVDLLVPAGPGRFEVADATALDRVVDHYGRLEKGAKVEPMGVDPLTRTRTFRIRTAGESWRVTEQTAAAAKEPAGGGTAKTDAHGKTVAHVKAALEYVPAIRRVGAAADAHADPPMADVVELRAGLAAGKLNVDALPQGVREKVFQGWKDVPEPLQAIAEKTNVGRIRRATPGVLRPEGELTNADVADSMNAQLQKVRSGEVDAMMGQFKGRELEARMVMARASGFARMEAMNDLRAALAPHLGPGKALYTPGSGSLADNLHYMSSKKKTFEAHPGEIATTPEVKPGTVVILDHVVLARIKDPAFAASLNAKGPDGSGVVLIQPRGFTDGINMFNAGSPQRLVAHTRTLLDRATKLQADSGGKLTLDEAITRALDEHTTDALKAAGVTAKVEVVDPAAQTGLSNTEIAKQLNGEAGVTAGRVEEVLAKVPESVRPLLRELLAQQAEVFSPRRIANDLAAMHDRIMAIAAQHGIARDKVYFLIPLAEKSYGMMAMAHREVTGTGLDHYVNGPEALAPLKLGPKSMVVVLDDVAGSGDSLGKVSTKLGEVGFEGQVVFAPMLASSKATNLFTGPGGLTTTRANTSYTPGTMIQTLRDSPLYKNLQVPQQKQLERILADLGYGETGLSVAFPYMAPNNNNAMFGDQLAKEFIVHKNRKPAKGPRWKPKLGGTQ